MSVLEIIFDAETQGPEIHFAMKLKVDEIKAAIPSLTLEERAEIARCLGNWQDDE